MPKKKHILPIGPMFPIRPMRRALAYITLTSLLLPQVGFAMTDDLLEIYEDRGDLQSAFDSETFQAIPGSAAGFLIDLEDWARQYGWQGYTELEDYAPDVDPARLAAWPVAMPEVTGRYLVIDDSSGAILAAKDANEVWPIASITKLASAKTALDYGLDLGGVGTVEEEDDVGGAKLWAEYGTTFKIADLLYATLTASANNAANAIARLTGYAKDTFVDHMNDFAAHLNLSRTTFVDPTGIEEGNVSTAREVAAFAREAFSHENIRKPAGTVEMHIEALDDPDYVRNILTTNWLLYDSSYDDVYVTAGKTGYLGEEIGWNLVVRMHPMGSSEDQSVLIVLLGADGRRESFDAAHSLAWWAWQSFDWERDLINVAAE